MLACCRIDAYLPYKSGNAVVITVIAHSLRAWVTLRKLENEYER